jgi:hypothetical protein
VGGEGFVINYDLSLGQRYVVGSPASTWDIALDPAGNTLLTGGTTLGFGPDGTLLWQQASAGGRWLRVDDSGNSYVGGWTRSLVVYKYDGRGAAVWTQSWDGEGGWASPSCFTLGADGVYIGGRTGRHGRSVLIKYAR